MLLSRMSLADKIAEMYVDAPKRPETTGYEGWVPAQPALCIPILREQDGSLGVFAASDATQLPSEVSLASTWNPNLAYRYGVVNAREHRAKGIAMVLGPGINIQRDPRWGRNYEMFSEDPLLTSVLGSADIEGMQSQDVIADVKHFVTYNQETYRGTDRDDTIVSPRVLHEIYLPPFDSAVEQAHVGSVMCAYPLLNGTYSCQNSDQLTGLLELRWGFSGFIRSDSGANPSTVDSANAGLDQERGSYHWDNGQLAAAVADGLVSMSTINAAVGRILTEMFRFNLFNDPPKGTISSPASTSADRAFALEAAEQGFVLLRNTGGILPLSTATTRSIAVIGADGTTDPETAGRGSSYVKAASVSSPLEAIAARAGRRLNVASYSGGDPARAAAVAAKATVAIVFASYSERERRDLQSIALPGTQNAVIRSVAAANHHTIVVLNTGGPVLMPWLAKVRGVLEGWYPGQEDGRATAAVLFGDIDPSGHLPETFPTSLARMPTAAPSQFPGVDGKVEYSEGLDVGYRWYDAHDVTPLFPFGYGLSYASFRFSDLTVKPGTVDNNTSGPDTPQGQGAGVAEVTAVITNTGRVRGSDVAQLYVGDPSAADEPPRQLEGFQRVTLAPRQSKTITFMLTGHELSYFSAAADGWTLPAGRFSVYVGDSSALSSLPLRGSLDVVTTIGDRYAQLTAPPTVEPGATFTVAAQFVNDGDLAITDATAGLQVPSTWASVPEDAPAALSLAAGQSATRYFRVTVPESAGGEIERLTAQLTSPGDDDAGDLSATTTVAVPFPISVTAGLPAVVSAGGSGSGGVSITNHTSEAVAVDLTATLPRGMAISPATPAVTVPANATVHLTLAVSLAPGTSPHSYDVPLNPSFLDGGTTFALAPAALSVDVPYTSLRAAYDNRAISSDGDIGAANFDTNGDSYSAQALSAAGIAPGGTVVVGTASLRWPDVPAGSPDDVLAQGQTVLMPAEPGARQLTVIGASSIDNHLESATPPNEYSGTGMIEYSNGTDQPFKLVLDNWFHAPHSPSNTTVATVAYVNDSTGIGNDGVSGRRNHAARIFAVSIPLDAGKTVSSVTLPKVATLPGIYPMHVFILALTG